MAVYNRFTKGAQRALALSQKVARELGHNYVGTEHQLYGLAEEGQGAAAQILSQLGVTTDKILQQIEQLIGRGPYQFNDNFGYTPRSKKIIEASVAEANNMGHDYVGTEHLLLALMHERECVAARIMMNLGVDIHGVSEAIVEQLTQEGGRKEKAAGGKKGDGKTPTLDQFTRDLTQAAREGRLDPVIGRAREVERIVQILSRRTKNNPVLIGEPGVGKSAVVEGLAQQIVSGNIPELLKNKRVLSLDLSGMLAGAKYRGEFEERLKNAMEEIQKSDDIILFIDELHTLIGAGAAEGAIDAANILKPALARGELQCIGATTLEEYRKHIEKDSALERRFQPVTVGEPTPEEAVEILFGLRDRYEAHHKVRITDEAIRAAVALSDRYISDRYLPDKAIDLMDEAASRVRIKSYIAPPDMKAIEAKLEALSKEKAEAVHNQNFEKAAQLRDEEHKLREEMEAAKIAWQERKGEEISTVGEEDIAQIVASWTNIPVKRMTEDESERLLRLEDELHSRVIGQDEAVVAVARAIRRARAGLKDPKRPIGSFIFLGPTGVGKTELSKALAESLFGDENAMIRIDMSEYMERHTVSRLVGSPPGYVGFDDGGQLTEKVRRKPYSVVLFDEIEKAHPDVFNILLQVLEDGRLTDSHGKTVDFRNTVVIMTSNVGAHTIRRQQTMGFGSSDDIGISYERMKENVMNELKQTFRPEFINRVDEIIVFHPLEQEHARRIVDLMLHSVAQRLEEKEIYLEVTDAARDHLAKEGFDTMYGARPLRRAIQRLVEDSLAEEILSGKVKIGQKVKLDFEQDQLTFTPVPVDSCAGQAQAEQAPVG